MRGSSVGEKYFVKSEEKPVDFVVFLIFLCPNHARKKWFYLEDSFTKYNQNESSTFLNAFALNNAYMQLLIK